MICENYRENLEDDSGFECTPEIYEDPKNYFSPS